MCIRDSLCDTFLDLLPGVDQIQLLRPAVDVSVIKVLIKVQNNASDIPHMLGLLADSEVTQFVEDQIFRRMDVHFTQRWPQIDELTTLEGRCAERIPWLE